MDNSQLQQYKNCPLSYKFKYVDCLKKREEGEESHHQNFGDAIHKGLEVHYRGRLLEDVLKTFFAHYPSQLDLGDLAKTAANGETLIREYIHRYSKEDEKWEILGAEVSDSFEIVPGIPFQVKIDLIAKHKDSGEIYGWDHKTTGKSLDYNFWNKFNPNSQITGYCAYIEQKYGQCSGIYINAMSFGYRQRAYKGEPAGFHYEFQRQLMNRSQEEIEKWKQDTGDWIHQLKDAEFYHRWPMNTNSCRFCEYRSICVGGWDTENDKDAVEVLYEKCDPLAYLKGE